MKSAYYFIEGGMIALAFTLMVETAAAYTGATWFGGTGFPGDGTVIKEEPAPAYMYGSPIYDTWESYSITEDTPTGRTSTIYDCLPNMLGQQTCTER